MITQQPKEIPYRFVNLSVYVLAALVNSLPVHTFSSINSTVEQQFHFRKEIVTANALIFAIFHPIAAFPANWVLDRFGSRIGCALGSIFVIIGVWLRTFMDYEQPQWCIIGSCFAAFGNIFILNTPMKIAVNWFKPSSIPTIIFAAVLANLVSITAGASIPGLVLDKKASKQMILEFIRVQAIVVTVPLVLLILLYRQKPSIPPSKSAALAPKKQKYLVLLKRLFSNKQYMKIMLAMMFSYGAQIAFISTLDQILKSLRYDDPGQTTSQTLLFAMLVGILANPIYSTFIKKTLKYKLITSINLLGSYISLGLLIYIFAEGVDQLIYIALTGSFVGFFFVPMTSLFFAYSAEVVFPIGEGSAGGYLFAGSQTFGFLLGLVVINVISADKKLPSLICLMVFDILIGLALLLILFTKQDLRRNRYERSNKKSETTGVISRQNLEDSLIVQPQALSD